MSCPDPAAVSAFAEKLLAGDADGGIRDLAAVGALSGCPEAAESVAEIMKNVEVLAGERFRIVYDPSLVRGMGYYTGTIFEIASPKFNSSIAGGGRYDKMVGKFLGEDVPAVGFSIGFERILLILMEQHFQIPGRSEMVAYLLEKDLPAQRLSMALSDARKEREDGKHVLIVRMNKNKKFQKQQLSEHGYTRFVEFYAHPITED